MEPRYGNPAPSPSFKFPIVPPTTGPADSPTRSFSINCGWLPFIRGALYQLVQQATWKAATYDEVLLAQQQAMTLIAMFDECDEPLPFACPVDFEGGSPGHWEPVPQPIPPWNTSQLGFFFGSVFQSSLIFRSDLNQYFTGIDMWWQLGAEYSLTDVGIRYSLTKGLFDASLNGNEIICYRGGTQVQRQNLASDTTADGTGAMTLSFAPTLIDTVEIQMLCGFHSGSDPGGTVFFDEAVIEGQGTAPC